MNARVVLPVVASAWLLHLLLAWPMPWERASWLTLLRPAVDLCGILALALVLGSPARLRRAAAQLAAGFVLLAIGARAAVTVVPAHFDLPFTGDRLLQLPAVWHLFMHDRSGREIVLRVGAAAVGLLIVWFLVSWATRTLLASCQACRSRRWTVVLVLAGCAAAGHAGWFGFLQPSALHPFAKACWHSLTGTEGPVQTMERWQKEVERAQAAMDAAGAPKELGGADVHLLIIESYGRKAWRDPASAAMLRRSWSAAGARLESAGWCGACCWWAPAVQGGGSHLSHMELLTGVPVAISGQDRAVMAQQQVPLPERLRESGYHTVDVQPAMPVEWPAGQQFYGFDRDVFQLRFGYSGFSYPWGQMPDQYALNWALRNVVRKAHQPLFLQFVSVSSHAPYSAVPPYEEDWSKVDNARFQSGPVQEFDLTFFNFTTSAQATQAYTAVLEYSLRAAVGYVLQLERPSLVLLIGDHQPPGAGGGAHPDPTPDVPMHAIANRADLIDRLVRHGFARGWLPPEDGVARPLADFAATFLRAFAE